MNWLRLGKVLIVAAATIVVAAIVLNLMSYRLTASNCPPEVSAPTGGWEKHGEFEAGEVETLTRRIVAEECRSKINSAANQAWDTIFKALILIFTIAGTGLTAAVAARKDKKDNVGAPTWLLVLSAMLTASVGVMGTFAATTYDFSKRQDVWDRRLVSLAACRLQLQMGNPSRDAFIRQLIAIELWNDNSSRSELTASCLEEPKTVTVPGIKPTAKS